MTTGKSYLAAMLRRGYAVPTLDVSTTLLFCHDAELARHLRQLGNGCCNLLHGRHSLRIICFCCCFSCFALCRRGLHCSQLCTQQCGKLLLQNEPSEKAYTVTLHAWGCAHSQASQNLVQDFREVTVTPWCSSYMQNAPVDIERKLLCRFLRGLGMAIASKQT